MTYHKTMWKNLSETFDEFISGFYNYHDNERKVWKIWLDLFVNLGTDLFNTNQPLFLRYYTKHHLTQDVKTNFDTNNEVWLSCDYDMTIRIAKITIDPNHGSLESKDMDNFEDSGDEQFAKLKNKIIDNRDDVERRIYKWVYKKIKLFSTQIHDKEIDTQTLLPNVLITLILNYLV